MPITPAAGRIGLCVVSAVDAVGIVAHGGYDALFVSARSVNAHNEGLNRAGNAVSVGPRVSPYEGRPGVQVRVGW